MTVDAKGQGIDVGDVVQIDPATTTQGSFFGGCFMIITEVKSFGAQGFICMPGNRGEMPGAAFFRCKSEDMVRIGRAEWTPKEPEGE